MYIPIIYNDPINIIYHHHDPKRCVGPVLVTLGLGTDLSEHQSSYRKAADVGRFHVPGWGSSWHFTLR